MHRTVGVALGLVVVILFFAVISGTRPAPATSPSQSAISQR
jgi:hypothetical protein